MSGPLPAGRLWASGAVAAATATIINVVLYGIARSAGVSFDIPLGMAGDVTATPERMIGAIVFNSVVPFALGLALTALVARRTPQRLRMMQIIAVVVTVLSFAQPVLLDAGVLTRTVLALMHIPPGLAFVLALQRLRDTGTAPQVAREAVSDRH